MKFYDRERETELLKKLKKDFRIAIVGRRRIGKTRLVEETFKNNLLTLFIPAEKTEAEIIRDWSKEYKEIPPVNTFHELFKFIFGDVDKIIFIDEIQNILKVNKSFIFDLQRLIDKYKPKLIVTGSLIRTTKKMIENYKTPLYGRFDIIIKLQELKFQVIYQICKDLKYSFEDAIKFYSVFGGIPKYYELLEKVGKIDLSEFVLNSFVNYPRPLYEEIRTMLKEEFGKEYKIFFSILSSISRGKNKLVEIANFVGREPTKITKYLSLLKDDFEIIEREVPVVKGKKGIYKIRNNLFHFWFSNIWAYAELIERNEEEIVVEKVKNNLNSWISFKFEDIIKEMIRDKLLFSNFTKIGKQWGKIPNKPKGENTYEIDLVGLNEKTKEILFIECKWKNKVNAEKICKELAEKAKYVEWNNEDRKESFAIFAKSFGKRIKEIENKKVYCFDLRDLERIVNSSK